MQTIITPLGGIADPLAETEAHRDGSALAALYDRTIDSVKGYTKMVEKAEPSFRDTAERFRALHAGQATAIARLLAESGVAVDAEGTVMGTVNKAVVTFRAFFDDIDEDVMDQVRSGEDWVLKSFDEAIAEQAGGGHSAALREMRAELTDLLADTRHLG
jgi:Domain of unknown function (DUF2383)